MAHQQTTTIHAGPLPAPEDLARYEQVLPGLADRIMAMAESQAKHRQSLESRVIWFDGTRATLGLLFGLVIALAGVIGGVLLVTRGYSGSGLASILVPLGVIVAAFIYQKRSESKPHSEQ
ncbi:MAG: DUF2335 domain-containing protein [Patescibacteria group bacterium]|nr:DUF2335 domain-containing protein [Patescibacteria group bacterium]MDE1943964.1 DUF2335 domain-containing protein [Patescibacteria group bacterium]MDE1944943.1 DUF2335 domain-containing protein [Patescibacteria group bacterium]MDE2057543.1 DUF2335 domain-containing protein [Patescibacteria group bacterium]